LALKDETTSPENNRNEQFRLSKNMPKRAQKGIVTASLLAMIGE
jgi:hypothetical protein